MSNAIALFAKAPIAGAVKTRLAPELTLQQSTGLYRAFVADTWDKLGELAEADRWLFASSHHRYFDEIAPERVRLQADGDLGSRMLDCFERLASEGYSRIVIVGADSPTIPAAYLRMSFGLLTQVDAVVGPAEDGGYYAVGCRSPRREMFDGVEWSSERAFEQTEAAFDRAGLSIARMPVWYDVDRYEDLRRLAEEGELPPNTRRWLLNSPLAGLLAGKTS